MLGAPTQALPAGGHLGKAPADCPSAGPFWEQLSIELSLRVADTTRTLQTPGRLGVMNTSENVLKIIQNKLQRIYWLFAFRSLGSWR